MRARHSLLVLFGLGLILPIGRPAPAQTQEDLISRGRYIVTSIPGCVCHTPRNPDGSYNTNLHLAGAPSNPPSLGHPANAGWTTRRWKKVYARSEEHTSELQSRLHLVCRLLLEKKKRTQHTLNR